MLRECVTQRLDLRRLDPHRINLFPVLFLDESRDVEAPGDGKQKTSDDELRVDVAGGEDMGDVGLVARESAEDEGGHGADRVERGRHGLAQAEHV